MREYLPGTYAKSEYQIFSKKAIDNRAKSQADYYCTCQGIFTMGKWLAADLVNRCGIPAEKVHHVGGGINLDRSLIDYRHKTGNKLLFVGRDFRRKGGHIVYEAFCQLKATMPEVELFVAGPSVDPFPENKVDGYHYCGDCDRNRLSQLFNQCDVFVMPSYFEAYGLVFIEAFTYGLPCIGRNCYEMPHFIEDGKTGVLLKEDNVEELAEMMHRLLTDESFKQKVCEKKDWYIQEYFWDTVARRVTKVMNT